MMFEEIYSLLFLLTSHQTTKNETEFNQPRQFQFLETVDDFSPTNQTLRLLLILLSSH